MSSPAQQGHDGLPVAAARDAGKLTDRIAKSTGRAAAIAWVHAGAVLAWAASHRLLGDIVPAATASEMRDGLKLLADTHPALADFTDPTTVPLWDAEVSDADASDIHTLWQTHPVDDPVGRPHGYLLGNAYQALSEEARKHRALAQTPRFITRLLLELGWEPAVEEHGNLDDFRMIDPSCGTGHILVETLISAASWFPHGRAFQPRGAGVERALRTVHGVDLDPYAALIARLRLVVMATGMLRAGRAPGVDPAAVRLPADWPVRVSAANALLDKGEPLLERGRYHSVIGNPPYITPKTATERDAVRKAYPEVCHGQYALSVPFHKLMMDLLIPGGWCAQLTANSFMKREFGKKYIEGYLTGLDMTWIIDTSGAYIPGHGTPTVILAHRNQPPVGDTVAAIQGVEGEPKQPSDPSRALVWQAIEDHVRPKLAWQRFTAAIERELNGGRLTVQQVPAEPQAGQLRDPLHEMAGEVRPEGATP